MIELQNIFHIQYGNQFDLNKMNSHKGTVHFVGRSAKNNGVTSIVNKLDDVKPFDSGLITVALGGSVLSSFVQVKPFYTGQNIVVLTPKKELTTAQKLFYCNAIYKNAYRFSTCGREANRTIKLLRVPSIEDIPAWVNTYDLENFSGADKPLCENSETLDTSSWKEFKYSDLFCIERGKGPRKKDLDGAGSTPVVTSSDSNNGLTAFTTEKPLHQGNTIGVNRNGSVAEAFYQPVPFCSTEDVHIFSPKFEGFNKYIGLFLISLIKKEKYRYSYGRKWGISRMNESIIKLPIDANGAPDWSYMERYIKTIRFSSKI